MKLFCFSLFCLLIVASEARTFQLCELFYYLRILGLDNYRNVPLSHYVCLAWFPSKMNTEYYEFADGISHYGIFRLKSTESCNNGRSRSTNTCKINCNMFLDDDITDDVECLKKLITNKLEPWPHFKKYCNRNRIGYIFTQCTYFFQRDEWFLSLTKQRWPHPLHVMVNK
ncbi:lysozyme C-2-like [Anolis carolinensis]|uniref:lysozyme C-2-like n=1 Tax=Anolis carolinensis TaxID=28377 RepID=UPI002F2B6A08